MLGQTPCCQHCIALSGEIEVVGFNHALLRDVIDAVDASNAYVHVSDCLVDAVLRQHGKALVQFGNSVFRVVVDGLNEDFLETWHEQESAKPRACNEPADAFGEQRELPCWASRNLVKIVAGHQELEMVFVAQEELVRDFVRVAAPALVEHNRMDVVGPPRHAADLKGKCARKVRAGQEPQPRHASKQLLAAPQLETPEQPKTCPNHVLSGERR